MNANFKINDIVALSEDLPGKKLLKGQVGTIVEKLDKDFYEVEFSDTNGETYSLTALNKNQIILLSFKPTNSRKIYS